MKEERCEKCGSQFWSGLPTCLCGALPREEAVKHPSHYGGADNPYEVIKVIEAWGLNFHLGNAVKYIGRAGKKSKYKEDLQKAVWYLQREIDRAKD